MNPLFKQIPLLGQSAAVLAISGDLLAIRNSSNQAGIAPDKVIDIVSNLAALGAGAALLGPAGIPIFIALSSE